MSTQVKQVVTIDIRCGYCNKKLSEITPPVTLMVQRIKCPRCGQIVDTYVLKPTKPETHKPQEIPVFNPVQETKQISSNKHDIIYPIGDNIHNIKLE